MKAASHTNRQEERRAQTHASHPTLRFDHEHTTATFGTAVRKYNMHTAETHMLPCAHTHTHGHTSSWSAARTNSARLHLAAASPPDSLQGQQRIE